MDRKFVLTVAVLFALFTLSHGRSPLDQPEDDVIATHPTVDRPESDSKTRSGILLPSERPEFGSETVVRVEPESKPSKLPQTVTANAEPRGEPSEHGTQTVPLTFISFRPINRHFPRRPFIPFFRHGHRCRHHYHRFAKPWGSRSNGREIPYGDDMIISGEDVLGFDPAARGGGVRQIPGRWTSFRHDGPRFPYKQDLTERALHREHGRIHRREEGEEVEEMRKQEHEGGLLKKIRKFLDHF